jgi:hypothetical protein
MIVPPQRDALGFASTEAHRDRERALRQLVEAKGIRLPLQTALKILLGLTTTALHGPLTR